MKTELLKEGWVDFVRSYCLKGLVNCYENI